MALTTCGKRVEYLIPSQAKTLVIMRLSQKCETSLPTYRLTGWKAAFDRLEGKRGQVDLFKGIGVHGTPYTLSRRL